MLIRFRFSRSRSFLIMTRTVVEVMCPVRSNTPCIPCARQIASERGDASRHSVDGSARMPFSPLATASMKLIASPGPFGLAFSAQRDAMAALTCDPLKGRPFVTGLRVMRLSAPLGGRDAYEFQLQCGAGATAWSALGPTPLLWASAEQAEASCNRPQSASGLQVTRGRVEMGRQDHYGFTLLCGAEDNLVEVDIAGSRHVGAQEQGGKRCPEDSFLSGIEVWRAFELPQTLPYPRS